MISALDADLIELVVEQDCGMSTDHELLRVSPHQSDSEGATVREGLGGPLWAMLRHGPTAEFAVTGPNFTHPEVPTGGAIWGILTRRSALAGRRFPLGEASADLLNRPMSGPAMSTVCQVRWSRLPCASSATVGLHSAKATHLPIGAI